MQNIAMGTDQISDMKVKQTDFSKSNSWMNSDQLIITVVPFPLLFPELKLWENSNKSQFDWNVHV